MPPRPARNHDLAILRDRIRQIEASTRHGVLPFGEAAIDAALPGGGLALGAVHEVLGAGGDEEDGAAASGFVAGLLARINPHPPLAAASGPSSPAMRERETNGAKVFTLSCTAGEGLRGRSPRAGEGFVLWCLKRPDLYGLGLAAHGLDPARIVLVAAPRDDEILWAVEEGLRAGPASGLVAVVGEIGRLPMVAGRRLQLAAERSGITAFLLRRWRNADEAAAERTRPSAAVTRWRIAALPSLSENPLYASHKTRLPPAGGQLKWRGGDVVAPGKRPGIGRPRWRVELLRVRGGRPGVWDVEVADATGHVSLSAAVADRPAAPIAPSIQRRSEPPVRRAG